MGRSRGTIITNDNKNWCRMALSSFVRKIKMKSVSAVVKVIVPITILSMSVYAFNEQRSKPAYQPVFKNGEMNKDIVSLAKLQNP